MPVAEKFVVVRLPIERLLRAVVGVAPAGVAGSRLRTSEVTMNSPVLGTTQAKAPPALTWCVTASMIDDEPWMVTLLLGSPPVHWTSTPAERTIVRSASALVQTSPGGMVSVTENE